MQSGGTKDMLAKRFDARKHYCNRAIRVHLGEQLRVYYNCMECTPPQEPVAELIERLALMAGSAKNSKAE